jgi:hypothetical protein
VEEQQRRLWGLPCHEVRSGGELERRLTPARAFAPETPSWGANSRYSHAIGGYPGRPGLASTEPKSLQIAVIRAPPRPNRTQEVAGSSPANSIENTCKWALNDSRESLLFRCSQTPMRAALLSVCGGLRVNRRPFVWRRTLRPRREDSSLRRKGALSPPAPAHPPSGRFVRADESDRFRWNAVADRDVPTWCTATGPRGPAGVRSG